MKLLTDQQYLGIDWGEKRIGLALADAETCLALPFKTVASLSEVLRIIKEEGIALIIIGSPQKMRGAAADNILFLNFLKELQAKSLLPVVSVDERLSSKAADALSGDKKDKAGRDEVAAAIILQNWLDSHSH